VMYALGFTVTAGLGLWQSRAYLTRNRQTRTRRNMRGSAVRW